MKCMQKTKGEQAFHLQEDICIYFPCFLCLGLNLGAQLDESVQVA